MKNMTLSSLPLILIGCTIACSGFDFRCPVSSEWRFRSKTCRNRNLPHYYCMFDANNNVSIELCKDKNDFQGAGEQFVFRGNPDKQNCFDDRYQPIWFWTNGSSECILLKSQCQGTGLFVFGNGSTTEDRACRCDHTRGYAFVAEPNNPCYCIPSEEDCSCYRKQCNKTSTLSFDYTCIPKDEPLVSSCNTSNESGYVEFQRPISKHVPDTREKFVNFNIVNYRYIPQIVVLVLTVIFVIIGVLGFLVIFCGICTPGVRCGHEVYYTSEDDTVQLDFCVVSFLRVSFEIMTANDVSQHIEPTHVDGKRKYYSFSVANVKYSDSGVYTCYVSHCFGTKQCRSKLLVEANPRFCVSLPFDVSIPEGEVVLTFEIPDEYNGIPVKSVSWKRQIKDDMVTVASTKESTINSCKYRDVTIESPFLRIMDVEPNDAGKYSCYISNGKDEMSASIIIGPPTVVLQECLQADGMEDNVELRCVAKSENIAIKSVMWRKNVDVIITDILADINKDKYAGGSPDIPSLTIHRLDNTDKGSYVCEVTNTFGKTESQPIVLGPPTITNEDKLYHDNRMQLMFDVASNIKIKSVIWKHRTSIGVIDISPNPSIEKYTGCTVEDPSLTISKPDSDDAGTYTCIITNRIGISESLPLVVDRPEIQIENVSCYAEIGSQVTIICNVNSSLPLTKVTWERNRSDVETMVNINDYTKFQGATPDNPSLTILNVDSKDLGSYICFAANPVGTVESPAITVTNVGDVPEIQIDNISCYAEIGSPVTITCRINSSWPITKVTWERKTSSDETTLVDINDHVKFRGGTPHNPSLTILNVNSSDMGRYICFATNPIGTADSPAVSVTKIKEKKKSTRTQPDEIKEWKDSKLCSPRVFTGKSMEDSFKELPGSSTDKTDWGINLHFAGQVVLTDDKAEKARQKARSFLEEEMRIVFVGKTGVGKSSTANTILGRKYFPCSSSFTSVTEKCMIAKTVYRRKHIQLIDTPGIFALDDKEKETEEEIKRCIHLAAPGPHAILFVIEYGRFKREDLECINTFLEYFGDGLKKFVIVVFTHVDKMEENETINGMIEKVPKLYKFIEECGDRYCKFNNNGSPKEKEDQIGHLFALISKLKTTNDFMYFTDDSILRAEERVREKVKEVEFDVREDCKRKHLQEIKELQEQMESTESPEKEINMIKEKYERIKEELTLECERRIEHAREKARKEFEDHEQFSGFSMKKPRKNRYSSS